MVSIKTFLFGIPLNVVWIIRACSKLVLCRKPKLSERISIPVTTIA